MLVENNRFLALVLGKACALAVLFLSLSNQMSAIVGVGYFNAGSFLACLVAAAAVLVLLPILRRPRALLLFSFAQLALVVAWTALLFYLQSLPATQAVPVLALAIYTVLGRIVTLFVNMQWNLHLALNVPKEAAKYAACSISLGLALFFACTAVGQAFAQLAIIAMLFFSSSLNLYLVYVDRAGATGPHGMLAVVEADSHDPLSPEAVLPTRILYFASRALYGVVLAVIVSLAAGMSFSPLQVGSQLVAACLALLPVLSCRRGMLSAKGELWLVLAVPLFSFAIVYLLMVPEYGSAEWLCVFALLAEVFWSTQNIFQLPTYRKMCGMHPVTIAFGDYLAQILPYYFCVWAFSSTGLLERYASAHGSSPIAVGVAVFVLLVACCIVAMYRHAVHYIPSPSPAAPSPVPPGAVEPLAETPSEPLGSLTSREREVFDLIAAGYSRNYIGKVLFISPDTVKVHAKHIYAKLGFSSKDDLIAFARGRGGTVQEEQMP